VTGVHISQTLKSKHDGALQQHREEMNDYTRQQNPKRAPGVRGKQCDGGILIQQLYHVHGLHFL